MMELSETNFLKTVFNMFKKTEIRLVALAKSYKRTKLMKMFTYNKKETRWKI